MEFRSNRILLIWFSCLLCLSLSSNGSADGADDDTSSKSKSLTSRIFNFFKKKNKNEHTEIIIPAVHSYGPNQYRYFLYEYPYHAYSHEPYHQANLNNLHAQNYYQTHDYNQHATVYQQVEPHYSPHDIPKGYQDNIHNHNAVDVVYPQVEPQYSLQETPVGFQSDIHDGLHEEIQEVVEEQLYPLGFSYFNYGLDHINIDGLYGKSEKEVDEEDVSSKYHEEEVIDEPQTSVSPEIHEIDETYEYDEPQKLTDYDSVIEEEASESTNVERKPERFAKAFMHHIQGRSDFLEPLKKFEPFRDNKESGPDPKKDNFAFAEHLRRGYGLKVFPKYAR